MSWQCVSMAGSRLSLLFILSSFIVALSKTLTPGGVRQIFGVFILMLFFLKKKQNTFFCVCVCYVPAPNKGLSYVSLTQKTWYGEGGGNREFFTEIMNRALQGKKLLY